MQDSAGKWSGPVVMTGVLLFTLALVLRVLFLQATADAGGPYSPYYKGDTPTWLDYAAAIRASATFDMGLPLRPPGVAYVVALLWNGQQDGYLALRLAWCLLGAISVALFYVALLRSFGLRVAVIAALLAAASTGLLIVSTSVNNETPYLLLVFAGLTLWPSVRDRPRTANLFFWAGLNGLACLVRVEHLLFFVLATAYLTWFWTRHRPHPLPAKQGLARLALTLVFFLLPLIPWHVHSWSQIEQFNQHALTLDTATDQAYLQLEQHLAGLAWSDGANRELSALPVFSQRTMADFVAATVASRGGTVVTADDFNIIDQAFGSRPEAIDAHPFVSVYGGLNFCLANNPWASGGFTRAPLDAPPPLGGGAAGYPAFMVAGLPPPELSLSYPPHLETLNHGYRLGWTWIREHPRDFLALAANKLRIFWAGISMGFTGYNLPVGLTGTRGTADMVIPDGTPAKAWRWFCFGILLLGLWAGRREPALVPWLLLAATKLVSTVGFFGYAREGAVLIPLLALLAALLATRGLQGVTRRPAYAGNARVSARAVWVSLLLAAMLAAVEGVRWASGPVVLLDGRQAGVIEPFPAGEYRPRQLQVFYPPD
jgi:hypothetical protein